MPEEAREEAPDLEVGEHQLRYHDQRHGVEEAQTSRERDDEEGEEPPSSYLRDAGDPVGEVVLGVHDVVTFASLCLVDFLPCRSALALGIHLVLVCSI